jgi:hypothetical protein
MSFINKYEYCIIALQRSGHHAVINWIIKNSKNGQHYFLNNCQPGVNPYTSFNVKDSTIPEDELQKEKKGFFSQKDSLIYNYEDKAFSFVFSPLFMENKQKWIGKSERSINMIVLRDPFNNFASKYKWAIDGKQWNPSIESIKQLPLLWKAHAKEFLGITNDVPKPKLFLNYNQWFSNAQYRKELAENLFLNSYALGIKEVAKWGPNTWGDSFDNMDYEGKANEMNVLERWRIFSDDLFFKSLFQDAELQDLSERIFGKIPGTEVLFQ